MYKLSYENFLYLILGLISLVILYKLFKKTQPNNEGFESAISRLKNKNNNKPIKIRQSKVSFDDLVKESEEIDIDKYTIDGLKKNFFNYIASFEKEDFKNVTGTTNEAWDKLSLFKSKFFEIFT